MKSIYFYNDQTNQMNRRKYEYNHLFIFNRERLFFFVVLFLLKDRGAWHAAVHGVTKSGTQLSN